LIKHNIFWGLLYIIINEYYLKEMIPGNIQKDDVTNKSIETKVEKKGPATEEEEELCDK